MGISDNLNEAEAKAAITKAVEEFVLAKAKAAQKALLLEGSYSSEINKLWTPAKASWHVRLKWLLARKVGELKILKDKVFGKPSPFSPKMKKLLRSNPKLALSVLSALRGPDDEMNKKAKARFTAPIRLWIVGERTYARKSYWPELPKVETLTRETARQLKTEALKRQYAEDSHYLSHIVYALETIQMIEGWVDKRE